MPNPSASTSWSAHRPGSPRSSDHAPVAPSRHTATPPLLSLDEYVSIVTAGPKAMAHALGRYVRPPATLSAEAPSENAPPDDAPTASPENASEAPAETTWHDDPPRITWHDDATGFETASDEMLWTDAPNVEMHRDEHAFEVPAETTWHDDAAETRSEEMLWHDDAPEAPAETDAASHEMRWEDEPGESASDEPAPDEAPVPDVMSTLTIPMPTVEDEPPTTASDMTETAPANAPPQPEEDRKKSDGARRWSWPWRS
ncbi:hypothetical protein [Rhodocaloribacter sp.]